MGSQTLQVAMACAVSSRIAHEPAATLHRCGAVEACPSQAGMNNGPTMVGESGDM